MRVLTCGDRHWTDAELVRDTLNDIHARAPVTLLIEGCAAGADQLAGNHLQRMPGGRTTIPGWARVYLIPTVHYRAEWRIEGRAAGVIRNQRMLVEGKPDLVVAFHDDIAHSRGTADMISRAQKAGVPVTLISHPRII